MSSSKPGVSDEGEETHWSHLTRHLTDHHHSPSISTSLSTVQEYGRDNRIPSKTEVWLWHLSARQTHASSEVIISPIVSCTQRPSSGSLRAPTFQNPLDDGAEGRSSFLGRIFPKPKLPVEPWLSRVDIRKRVTSLFDYRSYSILFV